ncbi:NAD(P)-dependent oxidoreductase [Arthrobacter sp. MA-N2]|uniref:NAD(P)-dependent oxidoreductase n=1 Tax=Arthrobacter sp. MA-N2 TaxID=1101188 RepID=UPI0004814AD3|nr:NAD(P)-dependent oxidoreductase [Arthrobacter sp. MA-N2]
MTSGPMPVGWLGTGKMGTALASRLLNAGHALRVWNRTPAKTIALRDRGAEAVEKVSDLGACQVVFVTVAGDADLEQVVCGPGGLLAGDRLPGIIVDCSTVSAQASAAVRAAAASAGVAFIAAPVSGNPEVVAAGNACIVASGPKDAYDRIRALLDAMAATVVPAGEGEGSRLVKLCHNLYLGIMGQALVEVTSLAENGGVRPQDFLTFLGGTVLGSPWLELRGPALAEQDWTATFTLELLRKDLSLGLAAARELNVPMPLAANVEQLATAAIALGYGASDMLALASLQPGNKATEEAQ